MQNTLFATILGRLYFTSKTIHDFINSTHFILKTIENKLECFIPKLIAPVLAIEWGVTVPL